MNAKPAKQQTSISEMTMTPTTPPRTFNNKPSLPLSVDAASGATKVPFDAAGVGGDGVTTVGAVSQSHQGNEKNYH